MQLETLIAELGILEHMKPLSYWRDSLIREKAEELKNLRIELTNELQSQIEALKTAHVSELESSKAELETLKAEIERLAMSHTEALGKLAAAKDAEIYALKNPKSDAELAFDKLPEGIKQAFNASKETASILIQNGRPDLAIKHIVDLQIPVQYEPVRVLIIEGIKKSFGE